MDPRKLSTRVINKIDKLYYHFKLAPSESIIIYYLWYDGKRGREGVCCGPSVTTYMIQRQLPAEGQTGI
jgi:hypothetical protein